MNTRAQSLRAWRAVRSNLTNPGQRLAVPKALALPHPLDAGARATTTWPVGQLADFVLQLELGAAPLLIREFADRYEATVAGIQLTRQVIRLVETNPTAALYLGGMLVGASIGAALTRDRQGALLGLALGLAAAGLLHGTLQPSRAADRA